MNLCSAQHLPLENPGEGYVPPVNPTAPDSVKDHNTTPPQQESVDLSSSNLHRIEAEKQASEAYQQGFIAGMDKAEEDYGRAAKALLLACQQLDTLRATIIGNSSKELLDFSLAIAERILRLSVREQDHTIVATIEEALRRAVKSDEFTIHIHPDDYETLIAKSVGDRRRTEWPEQHSGAKRPDCRARRRPHRIRQLYFRRNNCRPI